MINSALSSESVEFAETILAILGSITPLMVSESVTKVAFIVLATAYVETAVAPATAPKIKLFDVPVYLINYDA